MPAFVIFVEGADTEPDPLPIFFVDSEEHATRICEGISATEYREYKFSFHEVRKTDLSKFPFWAEMTIDARDGVYGNIVAGIYAIIDRAHAIISGRRSRKKIVSGGDTETGNGGSTTAKQDDETADDNGQPPADDRLSVDAIDRCGLNTDSPKLPDRDNDSGPETSQSTGGELTQPSVGQGSSVFETPVKSRNIGKAEVYHQQGSSPEWDDPPNRPSGWHTRALLGTETDLAEYILGDSKTKSPRRQQLRKLLKNNDEEYFGSDEGRNKVCIFVRQQELYSGANGRRLAAEAAKKQE